MKGNNSTETGLFRLEHLKVLGACLAILIALTACDQVDMKGGADGLQPDNTVTSTKSEDLDKYVKINIKGADPEKYVIQFSWPRIEDNRTLRIRLGKVLAEVAPSQTFFTHHVAHNQLLTYSFDILSDDRTLLRTFTKTVTIPQDYVVGNQAPLPTIQAGRVDLNRIFISSSAPLITDGKDITIAANEIHSDGGIVATFGESQTAPRNTNGRSGGILFIKIKKLYGFLTVQMRGENGGEGNPGEPYPGPAPAGGAAQQGRGDASSPFGDCNSYGANAGNGQPGAQGRPGFAGMTGGDSGNISISVGEFIPAETSGIPQDSKLEPVKIEFFPGAGGAGGAGGPGQPGGPGGEGNSGRPGDCRGDAGDPGPTGAPGPQGPSGAPGKVGKRCLYIASEQTNECE